MPVSVRTGTSKGSCGMRNALTSGPQIAAVYEAKTNVYFYSRAVDIITIIMRRKERRRLTSIAPRACPLYSRRIGFFLLPRPLWSFPRGLLDHIRPEKVWLPRQNVSQAHECHRQNPGLVDRRLCCFAIAYAGLDESQTSSWSTFREAAYCGRRLTCFPPTIL